MIPLGSSQKQTKQQEHQPKKKKKRKGDKEITMVSIKKIKAEYVTKVIMAF